MTPLRLILHPSSFILLFLLCSCIPDTTSSGRVVRISRDEHDASLLVQQSNPSAAPTYRIHLQHYTGNNLACPALDHVQVGDSVQIAFIPYHKGSLWIREITIADSAQRHP